MLKTLRERTSKALSPGVGKTPAATLSEVFAPAADAAAIGFVLSRLPTSSAPVPAPALWIQDRPSRLETGRPYLPGLSRPLLTVRVSRPADALAAAEEGLRCAALAAVAVEIWGDPPALDFTATKRLALRAEASGTPCWLIRHAASPDLSAARDRWRVSSLPSDAHPDDPRAPGDPRWRVELFRSRRARPGLWTARHDRAADRVDLDAPLRDGAVAAERGRLGGAA